MIHLPRLCRGIFAAIDRPAAQNQVLYLYFYCYYLQNQLLKLVCFVENFATGPKTIEIYFYLRYTPIVIQLETFPKSCQEKETSFSCPGSRGTRFGLSGASVPKSHI